MPETRDDAGNRIVYETAQDDEGGGTIYRDAQGNEVGRRDADGSWGAQRYTDPETGQTLEYDQARRREGMDDFFTKRKIASANRQTERERQKVVNRARKDEARRIAGAGMRDLEGAWVGVEAPSELDLMGGATESQLGNVYADQGSIDAQRAALSRMGGFAAGGYTPQEAAAMQRIRNEQAATEQQQRAAIHQQMAMRGMQGGGGELAGALMAGQGAANRANTQGLETQAQMFNRSLQATGAQGSMAGQMRGQSFDEGATRAQAVDAFHQMQGGAAQQGFTNDITIREGTERNAAARIQAGYAREDQLINRKENEKRRKGDQGNVIKDLF